MCIASMETQCNSIHTSKTTSLGDGRRAVKRAGACQRPAGMAQDNGRDSVATARRDSYAFESGQPQATAHAPKLEQVADDVRSPYLSDDDLALRFVDRHKDSLRFVSSWDRWMHFADGCWRRDETLRIFELVRMLCREVATREVSDEGKAKGTASAKTIAAVERLAKCDRRVAATSDQWDQDPWLLNTPSGTVELLTGGFRSHDVSDYLSKITTVTPDENCRTPLWDEFLQTITAGDATLIEFLYRIAGYNLTGDTREECLFFLYGPGGNGKGVYTSVLSGIWGEYHRTTPIETLLETKGDRHPTDLARLQNARLVLANETEEGRSWAEAKVKTLTGRDRIAARFMRQDFFEFEPKFKLVISGNHKPSLKNVDEAIRRRIVLVPFTVTIPADRRDPALKEKLRAEYPGILHKCIVGLNAYLEHGLTPPKAVLDATAEYLTSEDSLAAWRDEHTVCDPSAWCATTKLYADFRGWAEMVGERVPSTKAFSQALRDRSSAWGIEKRDTRTAKGFDGIRLKTADGSERM